MVSSNSKVPLILGGGARTQPEFDSPAEIRLVEGQQPRKLFFLPLLLHVPSSIVFCSIPERFEWIIAKKKHEIDCKTTTVP